MKIKITKQDALITSTWSGGTTTQLYISPENARYADRNFDIRVSTATVVCDSSNFTSLPDYSRKLMVLEGNIEINHVNRYAKNLSPFDVEIFEGNWETSSKGRCKDFNVMTKGSISNLYHQILPKESCVNLFCEQDSGILIIYTQAGSCVIAEWDLGPLETGDVMVCEWSESEKITIQSTEDSILIVTEIPSAKPKSEINPVIKNW